MIYVLRFIVKLLIASQILMQAIVPLHFYHDEQNCCNDDDAVTQ